jgi:hypothetical protein
MLFHKHLLINAKVEKPMKTEGQAMAFLEYGFKKIKNKKNSEHTTLDLCSVSYHSPQ